MEPTTRPDYRAFRRIPTRWMDNDVYGHINNVVHYSLFDTAVNGWLVDRDVLDFAGGEQVWLVVETGCRYFAEPVLCGNGVSGCGHRRYPRDASRHVIGALRSGTFSQR